MYWRQQSQENTRYGELMPTQEDAVLQTERHEEKQPGKLPTKGGMMRVKKVRGQLRERTRETYNFARNPLTTTPDCHHLSATPGSDTLK